MKRRLDGLGASTSSKATKKRSWKEDDTRDGNGSSSKISKADLSDSDAEKDVRRAAAAEGASNASPNEKYAGPNPVVWMEISVAGKSRGKVFFELFRDTYPEATELFRHLCTGEFKGTELHKIVVRKFAEGGDIELPASAQDVVEKAARRVGDFPKMLHAKAGLLSCMPPGPNGWSRMVFQVTLCPAPELDGVQRVFGQLVSGTDADSALLHALHWVSAAGNAAGIPRDTVLIEDCGVCDPATAERITGEPQLPEPPFPPPESQEERYARTGMVYARLLDTISPSNMADLLELTDDLSDYLSYTAKKAKQEGGGGGTRMYRSAEIEAELRELQEVLKEAEHKAGEVTGFENKLGRSVKEQQIRIKELSEILNRVF